jgi:hypothetical protein
MLYHILINKEARLEIIRELRRRGVDIPKHSENEKVSKELAKLLRKPAPTSFLERTSLLKGFLDKIKAERVRRIAAPQTIFKFRPLKLSKEMRLAMERSKELYS